MADVIDNPASHRFELAVDGHLAVAEYQRVGDRIVLTHTEVPDALAGRGVGSRLAAGVFQLLREQGRRAGLRCEFMAGYAKKHPEVADAVE
jgi:predicted GNAT family acetyltransferase